MRSAQYRPTFLAVDLFGLVETQPDVEGDRDTTRCGGWTASANRSDGHLAISIDGDGRPIDGLRAVLTAAWAATDAGATSVDAQGTVRRLGFS